MVHITRAVNKEYWIHDYKNLDNQNLVNSRLTKTYSSEIWRKIKNIQKKKPVKRVLEKSTLSTVIADREGNVVCGKHSINSDLWGRGLFVQGVLLNGSGDMIGRFTEQGQRRTQGAPNFLVFKNRRLKYALGTFSSSNPQAAFQLLVNLLDYGIPADQAVDLPRFGSYPYDEKTWTVDTSKNWLDKRISLELVNTLKKRGLLFSQKKPKLGKGCITQFHENGTVTIGYDKTN
jgi:gamma-glutamyltranspeptidase